MKRLFQIGLLLYLLNVTTSCNGQNNHNDELPIQTNSQQPVGGGCDGCEIMYVGWVKTDKNGKYSIYTIRPSSYPNSDIPAHINTSIKEPNLANEYYIDEFVFDDDKLLTAAKWKTQENRGGSGILKVSTANGLQITKHDIILDLNIPNHPR